MIKESKSEPRVQFNLISDRYSPNVDKEALFCEAILYGYFMKVDKLECSESFARQKCDLPYRNVLKFALVDDKSHWSIIKRQPWTKDDFEHYELGTSVTVYGVTYFIWLDIAIKEAEQLFDKYGVLYNEKILYKHFAKDYFGD